MPNLGLSCLDLTDVLEHVPQFTNFSHPSDHGHKSLPELSGTEPAIFGAQRLCVRNSDRAQWETQGPWCELTILRAQRLSVRNSERGRSEDHRAHGETELPAGAPVSTCNFSQRCIGLVCILLLPSLSTRCDFHACQAGEFTCPGVHATICQGVQSGSFLQRNPISLDSWRWGWCQQFWFGQTEGAWCLASSCKLHCRVNHLVER